MHRCTHSLVWKIDMSAKKGLFTTPFRSLLHCWVMTPWCRQTLVVHRDCQAVLLSLPHRTLHFPLHLADLSFLIFVFLGLNSGWSKFHCQPPPLSTLTDTIFFIAPECEDIALCISLSHCQYHFKYFFATNNGFKMDNYKETELMSNWMLGKSLSW